MTIQPDRPHLGWPFAFGNNVEQDTVEHIDARANVVIRCPLGFLEAKPEFGWPFPEFQNAPISTVALDAALRRWVDRNVTSREYADAVDAAIRYISVDVEA